MLNQLLNVRGVKLAALFDSDGALLQHAGAAPDPTLVVTGRAVAGSMVQALEGGALRDLVIDFETGPVLLTALGERTLVTEFDDVANLGRLRFAVKRVLPTLQDL